MIIAAVLLVICSGLTHAVWNLFAKKSEEKGLFLWAILVPSVLLLLPSSVWEIAAASLSLEGYMLIALSLGLQAAYGLLLTETYKHGDLSQVYPIMRGTSTLLIPAIGVFFLGESLSGWGWLGLFCIIAGIFIMSGWTFGAGAAVELKPVLLAFSVGLCTTSYVLVDKLNLQHLSPLTLLEVANVGFVLGITKPVLKMDRLKEKLAANWKWIAIGAVLNPGSYLLFLYAMSISPVSHISPIREIGVVFGTLLGIFVLKEAQGLKRVISSAIVALGIMIVAGFGA
ncbi:4-amino-4-deoxy-L-arabinose-phosphoundecaprenol flippase subunit ArnE [Paenibacillus konkukensis]|uniref:4-amino-4-deoxy-L-arabinose-phosphoundecaprenol flippase subunit ArnE n=1 Tax=Paenibacillus konkukensis TaxID=2020716 RepID=A0ABY4RYZ2_9BACL|nr:EamA family transporter [Paenibacillus konkukensis]UQZ86594.1 4-amino-4-deoxy-L-arabinose-phosphoundecaprenol flippase subunit ArnE [Paenibacillus konkukensis]